MRHTLFTLFVDRFSVVGGALLLGWLACAGCKGRTEPDDDATAAPTTSAAEKPLPLQLVPSAAGEGYYVLDVTAGDAKVSLRFKDANAPLTFSLMTEPSAAVQLGKLSVKPDKDGLATVSIIPAELLTQWLDTAKFKRSSSDVPVDAHLEVSVSAHASGDRTGKVALSVDLAGTATWWIHQQLDAKKDLIRPASPTALGVLLATPHGGLRYAGPGGGHETIGYLGSAMEQEPEVRDCGNYVGEDGKVGRVTFRSIKEATALVDRATYTLSDEWTEPEDPCKGVISGATVGGTRRPPPLWSAASIVEFWSRRMHKRGALWKSGTAQLEGTAWLPVVVLDDYKCEGDQQRVRFPDESLNWDSCVAPAQLRLKADR
jgi:hypothetical protein